MFHDANCHRRLGVPAQFLALVAFVFLLSADAGAQIVPSEPSPADIPRIDENGKPIVGLRIKATAVTRLPNLETFVMYGFIVGQIDRSAHFFFWNDTLKAVCRGHTRREGDGSGSGTMTCAENGAIVAQEQIRIPATQYGRISGTTRHLSTHPDGGQIETILRWVPFQGFPDYHPLINKLRAPKD